MGLNCCDSIIGKSIHLFDADSRSSSRHVLGSPSPLLSSYFLQKYSRLPALPGCFNVNDRKSPCCLEEEQSSGPCLAVSKSHTGGEGDGGLALWPRWDHPVAPLIVLQSDLPSGTLPGPDTAITKPQHYSHHHHDYHYRVK